MTTTSPQRPTRTYTVTLRDDGATEEFATTIPAGTMAEQDALAEAWAEEQAQEWALDGEWGDGGCVVIVRSPRDAESAPKWTSLQIRMRSSPRGESAQPARSRGHNDLNGGAA